MNVGELIEALSNIDKKTFVLLEPYDNGGDTLQLGSLDSDLRYIPDRKQNETDGIGYPAVLLKPATFDNGVEMDNAWAIEKVESYGLSSDYVDVIYLATILLRKERMGLQLQKMARGEMT